MAFDPVKYDIESWLALEDNNMLQKVCNIFDNDGFLVEQYKTRVTIVPVGQPLPYNRSGRLSISAPSLYRSFNYDDEGNVVGSVPEIREWTQSCEDSATGGIVDPEDPVGVPAGLKVAKTAYESGTVNAVVGPVITVLTKTLAAGESIYIRHAMFSGCWPASFQVFVDGVQVGVTKYLTWLTYDNEIWFNSANGGILYNNEETIEIKVKNYGDTASDFEASLGYVVESV